MTKYTKEKLEEAVSKNTSMAGVLRFFGIDHISGGMHAHIKKMIIRYGIDTSHFLGVRSNSGKNYRGPRTQTPGEILIKHSGPKQKTKRLRRALLESGIKEICSECGIGPKWNNKSLTLQIDHKNGDVFDDRIQNLRFLCPNCHTQTPTYGAIKSPSTKPSCKGCGGHISAKNKSGYCCDCLAKDGSKRIKSYKPKSSKRLGACNFCGKPARNKFCSQECSGRHQEKIKWPSNLPEICKDRSLRSVAKELGVSDSAIRKRLKRHHWAT